MRVLGIETSCDETGVAIYDSQQGLLADELYSQVALHAQYGGVVPELAARDHLRSLGQLIQRCLAQITDQQPLTAIAYTAGPGLAGALMTGASVAKSLAYGYRLPALGVHHLEAHIWAVQLDATLNIAAPFLALLVSGGHTQLIEVHGLGQYRLLGESLDDAAGEAFDKSAKLLGLPYPGGPALSQLAQQGDPERFRFPRPMLDRPGLDFSFSGLKTALRTCVDQQHQHGSLTHQTQADIAASFEAAIVDTLVTKSQRALQLTGLKHLVIAGGVSANQPLRRALQQLGQQMAVHITCPAPALCTDNGAMIAYTGCLRLLQGQQDADLAFPVHPRWPLTALQRPA